MTSTRRSASGPLGVGIIGLSASGGWAATAHVPALAAVDGIELRGLAASSADSARAAGQKYDVPLVFTDPAELAARPEIDVVAVTVKTPQHRDLVVPALDAGVIVLCEWPLGRSPGESAELAMLASAQGVTTMVELQARSAPAMRYLRDLIADGYVGDVLSTTMTGSSGPAGPEIDSAYAYAFDDANGANLMNVGFGASLDALQWVLGRFASFAATTAVQQPAVRTTDGSALTATSADQVAATGILDNGAVATVAFRPNRGLAAEGARWEIHGSAGDLELTTDGNLWANALTIRGAQSGNETLHELIVPDSYERSVPAMAGRSAEPAYNLAYAYAALVADVRTGTHTIPDFAEGEALHRCLDAVARAAATGTTQVV